MVFRKTTDQLKSKLKEHFETHVKPYLPGPEEPLWKRILAWGLFYVLIATLLLVIFATFTVGVFSIGLPDVRDLEKLAGIESTLILDREGGILYTIHGEENRKYVPLREISPFLQKATIAIEDDQFYEHIGFDIPGIVRGLLYEIFGAGRPRGGSTITQQLSKNAFLSPERRYIRKVRELILAIRLEQAYEKDKILELYLNRIPYGNTAYGAELASHIYFEKSAKDINLAEAAILASLPKAPTHYSPYGENAFSSLNREFTLEEIEERNIRSVQDLRESEYSLGLIGKEIYLAEDRVIDLPGRVDLVLRRMEELGFITRAAREQAARETRQIVFKAYRTNIRAPHFVFYVRRLLEEKYGKDAVESGGLRVTTTIDPKYQDLAEKLIAEQIPANTQRFDASNAAMMAVNPKTGEIISLVGSADYFNEEIDGNVNIVTSFRQPGSSFKPFVYAKAFLNGYSPATVLYDVRTHFGGGYTPNNFDGTFQGPMNIRRALGQSRNIPAIKGYFLAGQEEAIITLAEGMGIKYLREKKPVGGYGPALGIGAAEVRMIDMIQGFSVFANSGLKKELVSILKVEDRNGKVIEEWNPERKAHDTEVLDPQVAYLINHILSDRNVNLGPLINIENYSIAVKTGTSNKVLRNKVSVANNLWIFGYNPQVVIGLWAGKSDGGGLKGEASGYVALTPIFRGFLGEYLKDKPVESFPKPSNIKDVIVSKASGKLPGIFTPEGQKVSELFTSFAIPTEYDDMFIEKEVNRIDKLPPNPNTPPQYLEKRLFMNHHDPIDTYPTWLAGIQEWSKEMKEKDPKFLPLPPTETTPLFTPEDLANEPKIFLLSPVSGAPVPGGPLKFEIEYDIPHGFGKLEILIDGKVRFNRDLPSKQGQIFLTKIYKDGPHTFTARVYDRKGYFGEASAEIRIERDETAPADEIEPELTE